MYILIISNLRNHLDCKVADSNRAVCTDYISCPQLDPCTDKARRVAKSRNLGRSRLCQPDRNCNLRKWENCNSLLCTVRIGYRRSSRGTGICPRRHRIHQSSRDYRNCKLNSKGRREDKTQEKKHKCVKIQFSWRHSNKKNLDHALMHSGYL